VTIPQSFIQDLLARTDVVEIVGRYVTLKKGGANFMGLCPFHTEKSPSFTVSPSKQFYHCFGCGKNGNAIGFLMEHAGMSFVEAVHDLAQQYGMPVPEDDSSPQERERAQAARQQQRTLVDVLEKAGAAYRRQLKQSERAIDYLKRRGVSGVMAQRFGLGYAPDGWRSLASVFPDYGDAQLVEAGLVIQGDENDAGEARRYDRFRDRVMFPIRNVKGECIGFGGRVLGEGTPKYLNSPETPVFSKGRELYGLFEARDAVHAQGYVLVTEGYMDVVALAQLGFANAVATLGTACTSEHVHKLFRFTDAVVFSFDGDAAGRRAARKALDGALPYASDVRSVKFLFLPPEHDPDSFIRANGSEAFAAAVAQALPLSRFLLQAAAEDCDVGSAEGRARMASQARPLWSALPDGALKRQLLGELAQQVELGTHELSELWGLAPRSGGATRSPRKDRSPWAAQQASASSPRPGAATGLRRGKPLGRADHAVRLLLSNSALWMDLSGEDHHLLCELPLPHGPLFAWLDAQLQEHGPLPWGALLDALPGQPFEALARQLMDRPQEQAEPEQSEAQQELYALLRRMWVEHLKALETQAIAAAASDPQALAHYRELQARRLSLEEAQSQELKAKAD